MRSILALILSAGAAFAGPIDEIGITAAQAFARMPQVRIVPLIAGECGATTAVDERVAYCTSENVVLVAEAAVDQPQTPYLVGHAFGHAVQVRHGVADDALAAIRSRPQDELMLRGFVERQVDCIAGYLLVRAGVPQADLMSLFARDPLGHPHWGRDPLRIGPVVAVDLAARAEWFDIGQRGDLGACAPGEFTSEKLMQALRP